MAGWSQGWTQGRMRTRRLEDVGRTDGRRKFEDSCFHIFMEGSTFSYFHGWLVSGRDAGADADVWDVGTTDGRTKFEDLYFFIFMET